MSTGPRLRQFDFSLSRRRSLYNLSINIDDMYANVHSTRMYIYKHITTAPDDDDQAH